MLKLHLNLYSVFSGFLVFASFFFYLISLICFYSSYSYFIEWEVMFLNSTSVVMSLIIDSMSMIFLGTVCFISGSVIKYSEYYMKGDLNFSRFIFIVLLFVSSMLVLIISPNLISLLLGWDGLGLSSYALVIFYQNESSYSAGMLTVLSNRVGDVSILMGISMFFSYGSMNFLFFSQVDALIVFFICLAGMTKSAQIPFSAWLPAAMAAPTPVSSLVHSSTLVTAGVYLLIRFNVILLNSDLSLFLLFISIITMMMAGLNANLEQDMKKVVALSTLSQLGLMMMTLSLGFSDLAFFHLIAHAMFKSTLFLSVGFMIHSMSGYQDSRKMSGLVASSPVFSVVFGITNLALCGFPFLTGFYSKDIILELTNSINLNYFLLFMVIFSTGLTVSYSVRVIYLSFSSISVLNSVSSVEDGEMSVLKSLSGLYLWSMVVGYFYSWFFLNLGDVIVLLNSQKFSIMLVCLFGGLIMSYYLFMDLNLSGSNMIYTSNFLNLMWYMPFLSAGYLNKWAMNYSGVSFKSMDLGWLEYYGGQGGHSVSLKISNMFQMGQKSGLISSYLMSMLFILLMVLSYLT